MSNDFAKLLQDAGKKFANQTIAFSQVRDNCGKIGITLQADSPIAGADPRGILFYDSVHPHSSVYFTYSRISDMPASNFIAILQISLKGRHHPHEFARFIAKVDTNKYSIPLNPSAAEEGRWRNFKIATTQAFAFRPPNSPNVTIQFGPIGREVTFPSNGTTEFSVNGVFTFKPLGALRDNPVQHDSRQMHVQLNRDLCVSGFAPGSGPERQFGIFLREADSPVDLDTSNLQPPPVKWFDFEPDFQAFAANALDTPDEDVEESTVE